MSNSIVFKSTVFEEWFTSRLFPYVHYIPISMEFSAVTICEFITFFLLNPEFGDQFARHTQQWAKRVVRPQDMQCYTFRTLIELARIPTEEDE